MDCWDMDLGYVRRGVLQCARRMAAEMRVEKMNRNTGRIDQRV